MDIQQLKVSRYCVKQLPYILSDIIMYEVNLWPPEDIPGASEFQKYILTYFNTMSEVALEIIHMLAISLGEEESYIL